MIQTDETGRGVLQYEVQGVIRRIPLERRGNTKKGVPWVLGSLLMEVGEEGVNGSAQLYLVTFDEYLIETINTIGVGKKVKVKWHIDCRERYDSFSVSAILDDIELMTDGENFLLGKERK